MAESTNDVLIRFRTEQGNLKDELTSIESGLKKIDTTVKSTDGIIGTLRKRIEQLKDGQQKSFDPARIERYNKIIAESEKRLAGLTGQTAKFSNETKNVAGSVDIVSKSLKNLGTLLLTAFSVQQTIAFGKASFDAFAKAELSVRKLQAAVGAQGGLAGDVNLLVEQAKELQKITIFSDEQIIDAQTLALQFGLTADVIRDEVIPAVADFASGTGQDLNSALSAVLRGIEGNGRALKIYGVQIDSNATRAERFDSILEQLNKRFEGQAEIVGQTSIGKLKQLENAWDDLKETIGGAIAPLVSGIASLAKSFVEVAEAPISKKLDDERIALNGLVLQITEANISQEKRNKLIEQLQKEYPSFLGNLKAETVTNEQLKKRLAEVNTELLNKIVLQKEQEGIDVQRERAAVIARTLANEEVNLSRTVIRARELLNNFLTESDKQLLDSAKTISERARILGDVQQRIIEQQGGGITGIINTTKLLGESSTEVFNDLVFQQSNIVKGQRALNKENNITIGLEEKRRAIAKQLGIDLDAVSDKQEKRVTGLETKTEEELKKERDAAQKILEERQKLDKEIRDSQEALRKFAFQSTEDNITDEFTAQKEVAAKTIKDKDELEKEITRIELEELKARRQNRIEFGESTSDIDRQIADKKIDQTKKELDAAQEAADSLKQIDDEQIKRADELGDRLDAIGKRTEEQAQKLRDTIADVIGFLQDSGNAIAGLFTALNEQRLEEIENQKNAQLEAIDTEIDALEEKNNRGRISDEALEKRRKELIAQRLQAEKAADQQAKSIKRQQAEADKRLAIFNIILNTAVAIVKALGNPFLVAAVAALGAVQLGVAIATPVPAFMHGTKKKRGSGLAYVGEEGPELTFLPNEAKVLPHGKTKKYGEFIDAMFDDRLEKYVYDKYVLPALRNQGASKTEVNVNINERKLAKAMAENQNDSVRISNLHELADYMKPNLRRMI